ncbi:MAG TPA: hypothetical protein VJ890_14000 [Vineibacter sp.]|nr:hypothetical protein [Vineibacter sp.]
MPALIMPAMDDGDVVDLIAWQPDRPEQLYRRDGLAWCIGSDAYESALCQKRASPLAVHGNVYSWLKASGAGVLIVHWPHAAMHLAVVQTLTAATPEIQRRLKFLWTDRLPRFAMQRAAA